MAKKGFLGMKKRVSQVQSVQGRASRTKKRFKPPKPPAAPKATHVSGERYENNDLFSRDNNRNANEVQSMLDFLKEDNPSVLR